MMEQVEDIDTPYSQSDGSMIFTCVPQILARSVHLALDDEFNFVGAFHTHPDVAWLNSIDRNAFQMADSVVETFGVYNGSRLSMYADPGGMESMHVELRYSEGKEEKGKGCFLLKIVVVGTL